MEKKLVSKLLTGVKYATTSFIYIHLHISIDISYILVHSPAVGWVPVVLAALHHWQHNQLTHIVSLHIFCAMTKNGSLCMKTEQENKTKLNNTKLILEKLNDWSWPWSIFTLWGLFLLCHHGHFSCLKAFHSRVTQLVTEREYQRGFHSLRKAVSKH